MRVIVFAEDDTPLAVLRGEANRRGGAEKQLAALLVALSRAGHDVSLLHTAPGERADHDGIAVEPLGLNWRHPRAIRTLWQRCAQIDPAVIYSRMPSDFNPVLAAYARAHRPTRFLFGLANDLFCDPWNTYAYRRWFHGSLHALTLESADRILVQHGDQARRLPARHRSKTTRVPNIVAVSSDPPRSFDACVHDLIWVAQVRPEKQVDRFLDLAAANPDLSCALVGGFPDEVPSIERERIEQRLTEIDNLDHLGLLSPGRAVAEIRASRVLLNTSRSEGFPNTMLEAWGAGVPVVSLEIDPGRVIDTHRLGFVSRTATRLAADARLLAHDRTRNEQFGANGVRYVVDHHGERSVVDRFVSLVEGSAGHAAVGR